MAAAAPAAPAAASYREVVVLFPFRLSHRLLAWQLVVLLLEGAAAAAAAADGTVRRRGCFC